MIYTVHTHVRMPGRPWMELKAQTVSRPSFVEASRQATARYLWADLQHQDAFVRIVKRYTSGRSVLVAKLGKTSVDGRVLSLAMR